MNTLIRIGFVALLTALALPTVSLAQGDCGKASCACNEEHKADCKECGSKGGKCTCDRKNQPKRS